MLRRPVTAAFLGLALAFCSAPQPSGTAGGTPAGESPVPQSSPAYSPAVPAPQTSPAPAFSSRVQPVEASKVPLSWRPGCPVPLEDLRLLTLSHWGFDGRVHTGEMVVHSTFAGDVVQVMSRLFEVRFPIDRMELVDVYGAEDARSTAANNTSAFNCREVQGSPGVWSQHSYGRAIDINPAQNPFLPRNGPLDPPAGASYTDRANVRPGMIVAGDEVVRAFGSIGWEWGGTWSRSKDYQHFSSNGL